MSLSRYHRNMDFSSSTRFSIRPSQLSRLRPVWIVLLILGIVSSPFQFLLGNCDCLGCQCCTQASSIDCCEASCSCCSAVTNSSDVDPSQGCCFGCSSCGAHCQCGAIEVTPSNHHVGQTNTTDSVDALWRPSTLAFQFVDLDAAALQTRLVSFPDLVCVRLHAFLCVWLN